MEKKHIGQCRKLPARRFQQGVWRLPRALLWLCASLVLMGSGNDKVRPLSPQIPVDVPVTGESLSQDDLDNYSWQLFVALNWPATRSGRPPGDIAARPKNPRVWETFIDGTEILERDPGVSLRVNAPFRLPRQLNTDFFLQTGSDLPAIDGGGNFTVNEMVINPVMADYIISNGLTTTAGIAQFAQAYDQVVFPEGAIEIKAGWYILPPDTDQRTLKRFYTTTADISVSADDSASGDAFRIEGVTVALIAFHISQKTRGQAQRIWSTFEHVDLLEGSSPVLVPGVEGAVESNRAPLQISNNEKPEKYLWQNLAHGEETAGLYHPSLIARSPNEVPYPAKINQRWQRKLPKPWSNYRLVITQWIDEAGRPQPENSDGIAIAGNAALESYLLGDQTISLQVPGTDLTNDCPQPGDGSTLWAEIEQIINYDQYPGGVVYTDTWTSCLMCHQLALYKWGDANDDVIGTDFSFVFKSIMPVLPCTSGPGSPL